MLLPALPGPWTRIPNDGNWTIPSNGAARAALMPKTMRLENLAWKRQRVTTRHVHPGGECRRHIARLELRRTNCHVRAGGSDHRFGSTYALWPSPYQPTRAAKFMRFALRLEPQLVEGTLVLRLLVREIGAKILES